MANGEVASAWQVFRPSPEADLHSRFLCLGGRIVAKKKAAKKKAAAPKKKAKKKKK